MGTVPILLMNITNKIAAIGLKEGDCPHFAVELIVKFCYNRGKRWKYDED